MSIRNLLIVFIAIFLARLVWFGAGIGDALTMISLCALYSTHVYFQQKQVPNIPEQLKQEIENIKSSVASIKVGVGFLKK